MSGQKPSEVIYLSGPMTGLPNFNRDEFRRVASELYEKGYEVINPADLEQPDLTWESCLRVDIAELVKADTIAMLKGWKRSKGAILELTVARTLGMKIVDAYTLDPIDLDITIEIKEAIT